MVNLPFFVLPSLLYITIIDIEMPFASYDCKKRKGSKGLRRSWIKTDFLSSGRNWKRLLQMTLNAVFNETKINEWSFIKIYIIGV